MKYLMLGVMMSIFGYGYAQPPGYSFGKQLTINSSQVAGTTPIANFPVLVSLTDPDLIHTASGGNVQSNNGFDIVFGLDDCATLLSHDLEFYNPNTGQLVVWVQVPLLDPNSDTPLVMFYGNAAVLADQSTTNVWTGAGFDGVWHLHNDFTDASGSGNNGVNNGSTNISPANNSADGQSFVDPNHWIELSNHPARSGDFSYSGWVRTLDNTRSGQRVICDDATNTSGCHALSIGDGGTGVFRLFIRGMAPTILDSPRGTILNNTWHYVTATFNGSTKLGSIYVDGALVNSTTYSGNMGPAAGNASIGGEVASGEAGNRFNGDLDEIRASNSLLSPSWIRTEYNNQNSPSTFYTVSGQLDATLLCVALPIELLSFQATALKGGSVRIDWQTSSETDNDYFTIERSVDGLNWETVSRVEGSVRSSSVLSYQSIDPSPYPGLSFYRLKQTDLDGQFETSPLRSVNSGHQSDVNTQIYPNPTDHHITLVTSPSELEQLRIFNSLGQEVSLYMSIEVQSPGVVLIDLSELAAGIYLLKTQTTSHKVYKN